MDDVLRQCIKNFGEAPRKFSLGQRFAYLRVQRPAWVVFNPTEGMGYHLDHLESLFIHGIVTWGHVVQANAMLFEDGPVNLPGELVYSLEDRSLASPEYLKSVAHYLFELKGTLPDDPQLGAIAEHFTNEHTHVFGLPVPGCISPLIRCRISSTYFVRHHLPRRRTCRVVFRGLVGVSSMGRTIVETFVSSRRVDWP